MAGYLNRLFKLFQPEMHLRQLEENRVFVRTSVKGLLEVLGRNGKLFVFESSLAVLAQSLTGDGITSMGTGRLWKQGR